LKSTERKKELNEIVLLEKRQVSLNIPGIPIPWKAPYVGSRGAFSPRYKEMKIIKFEIDAQYKGPLIDTAVWVDLFFFMPIPKSTSKKKRQAMIGGFIRPTGTPDRCNLCKLYEDCLQGIVIGKDSKIIDGRVAKFYGEEPCTLIHIKEI
jgi:Holliday junction resolvase RusA-like endonuclease